MIASAQAQEVAEEIKAVRPLEPRICPSPFRSEATLSFATSRSGPLRVDVIDLAGRNVRQLVNDADAPAGMHMIRINTGGGGEPLNPGIYFYRVDAREGVKTGRFVVLR